MKAIVRSKFGKPDVLSLDEIEQPPLTDDALLVRVRASSVNPADWYAVAGTPLLARPAMGFFKPRVTTVGVDFAGTVEAVGANVTQFRVGDEVFGGRDGALAEYIVVREERAVAHRPSNITVEQAASVGVAGLTALQGLRDKGKLQPGQRVLINGASGGVGTFAVQIAKALGAEVTAVCSTRNVEQARSLGADHVVDYTSDDFTRTDVRYDILFDIAGSRSWSACRRVLQPRATLVLVGAPKGSRFLGPISHLLRLRLASMFSRRKVTFFVAKFNKADMQVLADLMAAGKVVPVIDRRYDLSETAEAFRYLGEGHAKGKVVVAI